MGYEDDPVEGVYTELVSEVGAVLPDFDFRVGQLYARGEPEGAIILGIAEAAAEGIPLSARLMDSAKGLFPEGEDREIFEWAAAKVESARIRRPA